MRVRKWVAILLLAVVTQTGFGWSSSSNQDDISDVLNYLFGHGGKPKGLPADPRTVIKLEQKESSPIKFTVGMQTDILGVVQADLKTEVEYERDYQVTTWIFVEGENADVISRKPEGTYYFDPGNRRAVRLCAVSASLTLAQSFIGKVFVAAGGVEKTKKYSGMEEVLQTSELVEIKPGESPEFHKRACDEFAQKKYAQVMKTLEALATSRIYWDDLSQCNPKEEINRDSVCGTWHRTLFPSVQAWTVPVCERRAGEKNYFCNLHSIKGGACPYRDPETKQRLTSGMFEYSCAKGLYCALTKEGGFFSYAKAQCKEVVGMNKSSRNTPPTSKTH